MQCNASQPSMKPVAVTISHPLTLLEQAVKEVGRVDDVEGNAPDLQVAGALEPEKSVLRRANPLMPSTPKLKFSSCCSDAPSTFSISKNPFSDTEVLQLL